VFIEAKMMEVVVTTGAITRAKLQSNHHHQETNTQLFTVRMPFLSLNQQCRSTEEKRHYLTAKIKQTPQEIPIHKTVLPSASFVSVDAVYFLFLLTVLLACSAALSTLDVTVAL